MLKCPLVCSSTSKRVAHESFEVTCRRENEGRENASDGSQKRRNLPTCPRTSLVDDFAVVLLLEIHAADGRLEILLEARHVLDVVAVKLDNQCQATAEPGGRGGLGRG